MKPMQRLMFQALLKATLYVCGISQGIYGLDTYAQAGQVDLFTDGKTLTRCTIIAEIAVEVGYL